MKRLLFILPLLYCISVAYADITSNLVLYLRLNEGSGTTLTDSGSGAHTASTNAAWLSGASCKQGACLSLNGTSQNATVNDAGDLSPTNGSGTDTPFSLTLWAFITSITPTQILIGKVQPGSIGDGEWTLWLDNSTLYFQIYQGPVGNNILLGRSAPLTAGTHQGQWIHVAATYSASETNAGLKIYVNGTQIDTANASNGAYTGLINTACLVELGSQDGSTFLAGRLDEVKYFQRELTSADVTQDMNSLSATLSRRPPVVY